MNGGLQTLGTVLSPGPEFTSLGEWALLSVRDFCFPVLLRSRFETYRKVLWVGQWVTAWAFNPSSTLLWHWTSYCVLLMISFLISKMKRSLINGHTRWLERVNERLPEKYWAQTRRGEHTEQVPSVIITPHHQWTHGQWTTLRMEQRLRKNTPLHLLVSYHLACLSFFQIIS